MTCGKTTKYKGVLKNEKTDRIAVGAGDGPFLRRLHTQRQQGNRKYERIHRS